MRFPAPESVTVTRTSGRLGEKSQNQPGAAPFDTACPTYGVPLTLAVKVASKRPPNRQRRVALGTQTVDVWKDARELGKAAGEAAVALAQGTALADVPNTAPFDSPGGNKMTSILLTPQAITPDNLDVVVDAGWISKDELCQGVEAGTVEVCG